MAADPQFMQALAALGQAGQQFFVGEQVKDVNARAQQIRDAVMPDMERRRALQELAQSATISVAGSGGSAQQLSAIQSLVPPVPNSAAQAVLTGRMTGDAQMEEVGMGIINDDRRYQERLMEKKLRNEAAIADSRVSAADKKAISTENRKYASGLQEALPKLDKQLSAVRRARALMKSSSVGITGPFDQYPSKFTSKGQELTQALNEISLVGMVETFAGMSKAVDSDNERAAWSSTQPSMNKHESANLKDLERLELSLVTAKQKTQSALYGYRQSNGQSFEAVRLDPAKPAGFTASSPSDMKSRYNKKR